MTKFGLLGGAAAVVLSTALAGPAMAQEVINNPGRCAQYSPDANCQNKGPGNPYTGDYQRRTVYRTDRDANWNNGWHDSWNDNRRDFGISPGDVAAGAVNGAAATAGAAVGTAGAIATAPFRSDFYAYYDNGDRGWSGQTYAQRNGFVCQPGTWFKGEDGRRHPCQ